MATTGSARPRSLVPSQVRTGDVIERAVPGLAEAMRAAGHEPDNAEVTYAAENNSPLDQDGAEKRIHDDSSRCAPVPNGVIEVVEGTADFDDTGHVDVPAEKVGQPCDCSKIATARED